jgi:hypothetical protein
MSRRSDDHDHFPGFIFGLVTGTALGAGLAMYFFPKIGAEIRQRLTTSA